MLEELLVIEDEEETTGSEGTGEELCADDEEVALLEEGLTLEEMVSVVEEVISVLLEELGATLLDGSKLEEGTLEEKGSLLAGGITLVKDEELVVAVAQDAKANRESVRIKRLRFIDVPDRLFYRIRESATRIDHLHEKAGKDFRHNESKMLHSIQSSEEANPCFKPESLDDD